MENLWTIEGFTCTQTDGCAGKLRLQGKAERWRLVDTGNTDPAEVSYIVGIYQCDVCGEIQESPLGH